MILRSLINKLIFSIFSITTTSFAVLYFINQKKELLEHERKNVIEVVAQLVKHELDDYIGLKLKKDGLNYKCARHNQHSDKEVDNKCEISKFDVVTDDEKESKNLKEIIKKDKPIKKIEDLKKDNYYKIKISKKLMQKSNLTGNEFLDILSLKPITESKNKKIQTPIALFKIKYQIQNNQILGKTNILLAKQLQNHNISGVSTLKKFECTIIINGKEEKTNCDIYPLNDIDLTLKKIDISNWTRKKETLSINKLSKNKLFIIDMNKYLLNSDYKNQDLTIKAEKWWNSWDSLGNFAIKKLLPIESNSNTKSAGIFVPNE